MPKRIVVNLDELKGIRTQLNSVINASQTPRSSPNQPRNINQTTDLDQKEKTIFEHIRNHPGCIKQEVVNAFENKNKNKPGYSRKPVFKIICRLERYGMIIVKPDSANSQIHHLFINEENVLVLLIKDFGSFKQVYFKLIDSTKGILIKLNDSIQEILKRDDDDSTAGHFVAKATELTQALLHPYIYLIRKYIFWDLFWMRQESINKDAIQKKFTIIYQFMQEVYLKLQEALPSPTSYYNEDSPMRKLWGESTNLGPADILIMLKTFEKNNLSEKAEAVMDSLWKISYPILHLLDYDYVLQKEKLTDWRNVIGSFDYDELPGHSTEENKELFIQYVPKTKQIIPVTE